MPNKILEQFAAEMPRLQAQEDLRMAQAVALGAGYLKRSDRRRLYRMLQRQADGPGQRRERAYRPKSTEERHALMGAMGIVRG